MPVPKVDGNQHKISGGGGQCLSTDFQRAIPVILSADRPVELRTGWTQGEIGSNTS